MSDWEQQEGGTVGKAGEVLDRARCPLCGETNGCGMEAGKGTCWCMALKIPAEVLERVPAEARNEACVCERCATGGAETAGTRRALRVSG